MLDFLGDIGGLFGALNAIFGGIVIALQFNGLHQYITPNMYRVQEKKSQEEKFKSKRRRGLTESDAELKGLDLYKTMEQKMREAASIHKMKTINYSFFSILKNNLQRYCPLKMQVCCLK